jgi:hypothetical protein
MSVCVCVHVHTCGCSGACIRVALFIQHAVFVHHIVTPFVVFLAPSRFSTLLHEQHDFQKKVIKYKICVLIFSATFV